MKIKIKGLFPSLEDEKVVVYTAILSLNTPVHLVKGHSKTTFKSRVCYEMLCLRFWNYRKLHSVETVLEQIILTTKF